MPAPVAGIQTIEVSPLSVGIPRAQTIDVTAVLQEPVAYGPRIVRSTDDLEAITATVYRRAAPNVPIRVLSDAHSRRWLDELNEPGSASVVLQNDDPDLSDIEDDDLIRFELYGWSAFTMLARDFDRQSIAQNEEVDETTTVSGPGHLAILEEAVVYPSRGCDVKPVEEDRLFNWAGVDYDDTDWDTASQIAAYGGGKYWVDENDALAIPSLDLWPVASGAVWMWGEGNDEHAAEGTCYFRSEFVVTGGHITIFLCADDRANLYFDGQLIMSTDNGNATPADVQTAAIECTPGTHLIAIEGTNAADDPELTPGTHNPAGVLCAVYPTDAVGNLSSVSPLLVSSAAWKVSSYPGYPPGMTPGEVLRICVEEAQARGGLVGVTYTFTDDVDSEGVPWPEVGDIATKVGTDYMTFFRELSATYIDLWMAPHALELHAWVMGGRGQTTSVEFAAGVNLAQLKHRKQTTLTNGALVRWPGGWHEVTDASSISANGRSEGLLGLGVVQSIPELERVATGQLDVYANPRETIAVDLVPVTESDTPYLSFLVGDTVTVPDSAGDDTTERVLALTVSEDENGAVFFVPELKDIILEERERVEQSLKKMTNGTMRGDSKVATPVSAIRTLGTPANCCPPQPPDPPV